MNSSIGVAPTVDGSGAFADCASARVARGQSPRRIRNTPPDTDALFRLGRRESIVLFKPAVDGLGERRDRPLPGGKTAPGGFR